MPRQQSTTRKKVCSTHLYNSHFCSLVQLTGWCEPPRRFQVATVWKPPSFRIGKNGHPGCSWMLITQHSPGETETMEHMQTPLVKKKRTWNTNPPWKNKHDAGTRTTVCICFRKWWFPPIIHFDRGDSIINHPFWGTPIFWKHPYLFGGYHQSPQACFLGCWITLFSMATSLLGIPTNTGFNHRPTTGGPPCPTLRE